MEFSRKDRGPGGGRGGGGGRDDFRGGGGGGGGMRSEMKCASDTATFSPIRACVAYPCKPCTCLNRFETALIKVDGIWHCFVRGCSDMACGRFPKIGGGTLPVLFCSSQQSV